MRRAAIGLVLVSLVFVLIALGRYGIFRYKTRHLDTDSAKVETLAAKLLPGAHPPSGLTAVASFKKNDADVVVLAPSLRESKIAELSGEELRFVIMGLAKPPTGELAKQLEYTATQMEVGAKAEGIKYLEKSPAVLTVAGKPHPALRITAEVGSGGPQLKEFVTIFKVKQTAAVLIVSGPKDSFNQKAMQTFLDGLKVDTVKPPPAEATEKPAKKK